MIEICVFLVVMLIFAVVLWKGNECPAGFLHEKRYGGKAGRNVATFYCTKCGGVFTEVVSDNEIAKLEYKKNRE
jgi:hypothetical protein